MTVGPVDICLVIIICNFFDRSGLRSSGLFSFLFCDSYECKLHKRQEIQKYVFRIAKYDDMTICDAHNVNDSPQRPFASNN